MTLTVTQSNFTYRSESGGQSYYFTIVVNQNGVIAVRDWIAPTGPIRDSCTQIPQSVINDQTIAIGQVENILAQTSAVNGILTFTSETSKTVTFATPMANTNYRVVLSTQDFVPFRVSSKLMTEFTIQTGITYTGNVGFDVFV
jgi:hypothetical protein